MRLEGSGPPPFDPSFLLHTSDATVGLLTLLCFPKRDGLRSLSYDPEEILLPLILCISYSVNTKENRLGKSIQMERRVLRAGREKIVKVL